MTDKKFTDAEIIGSMFKKIYGKNEENKKNE